MQDVRITGNYVFFFKPLNSILYGAPCDSQYASQFGSRYSAILLQSCEKLAIKIVYCHFDCKIWQINGNIPLNYWFGAFILAELVDRINLTDSWIVCMNRCVR